MELVNGIIPAAKADFRKPGDLADIAVRESASRRAIKIATKSEIVSHLIKTNKVKVLAARYDLDNGRVAFLSGDYLPVDKFSRAWQYPFTLELEG